MVPARHRPCLIPMRKRVALHEKVSTTMNRSMKSFVFAAVLAAGFTQVAVAQVPTTGQPRRITLNEALQIGLRQNSTLQQAENSAETAEIAVDQAKMRFLPNLSASIG